ncbi:MAG: DUF721 domain-containing protein [Candidatus Dadabacteria bacterium]|nr:MAG: DUF721 domain-containing protein [Candidatus Dadabacteria bacterium]
MTFSSSGSFRGGKPQLARVVLGKFLRKHKLEKKLASYRFIEHWREIVGDELAKISTPLSVEGNSLIVSVPDSVWAQELSLYKKVILKRLEPYFSPLKPPRDIKFRKVGSLKR